MKGNIGSLTYTTEKGQELLASRKCTHRLVFKERAVSHSEIP